MKAKDLKERDTKDLVELKGQLEKDLFVYKMKNFTNQLDDTSLLLKTKRDIARINTILGDRARQAAATTEAARSES